VAIVPLSAAIAEVVPSDKQIFDIDLEHGAPSAAAYSTSAAVHNPLFYSCKDECIRPGKHVVRLAVRVERQEVQGQRMPHDGSAVEANYCAPKNCATLLSSVVRR